MDTNYNNETTKQQTEEETGSVGAAAQNILERGSEAYGKAEQAVSDAYDKTKQKVSETYDQAKNYSNENPGKTILVALGIGIGLGLLLSASSGRSRTSRIANPVINALSDIAHEFFH
jgi:ElaB/YqjD/DUF883 family membrane-anchored ribosome-binding protein